VQNWLFESLLMPFRRTISVEDPADGAHTGVMLLLVPADPLRPRRADEHFVAEAAAARAIGYDVALIDHDALTGPDGTERAAARVPDSGVAVYRGWMMLASGQYAALADAVTTGHRELMQPRIQARYRREHAREPAVLSTAEDVDAMIDSLFLSPVDENLAQVHSLQRPLLPSGVPDHEVLVGVDGSRRVGVVAFGDSDGNAFTLSSPEDYRDGEVAYCIMGHRREFPDHSEVPVDLVRQAVKEFLFSGGQRPECVQWRIPEEWLCSRAAHPRRPRPPGSAKQPAVRNNENLSPRPGEPAGPPSPA
jgi:hypothetical protein